MRLALDIVSALLVFLFAFVLAGWFLMPHLPPVPSRPVSVWEPAYWVDNWIGVLLGLVLGGLSLRASRARHSRGDSPDES
jgi:hypothetical protein